MQWGRQLQQLVSFSCFFSIIRFIVVVLRDLRPIMHKARGQWAGKWYGDDTDSGFTVPAIGFPNDSYVISIVCTKMNILKMTLDS